MSGRLNNIDQMILSALESYNHILINEQRTKQNEELKKLLDSHKMYQKDDSGNPVKINKNALDPWAELPKPTSINNNYLIDGVGKDAPTVVNDKGGKQSHSPYRFDLVDPDALFEIAKVLGEGAEKYGENNWHLIDIKSNLNHALQHIYAYLAEDTTDDHLAHAACRVMFALALYKNSPRIQESQAK